MPDRTRSPMPADAAHPQRAWRAVARLRRSARLLLISQRSALILAAALAACLAVAVADYFLRTPDWFRLLLLAAMAAALVAALARLLWPALRFTPPLTEFALRIERSPEGRSAGLKGILASGIELPDAKVGAQARQRLAGFQTRSLLQPRAAARALGLLLLASALTAGAWIAAPQLASIGAARVLTPWQGAQWPKRTHIADATTSRVHPLGAALPLRAALLRSDRPPEQTRVTAHYRLITNGAAEQPRRVLLTNQNRPVAADPRSTDAQPDPEAARPRTGTLFERLIEPASLPADHARRADRYELEYWFETEDDRTPPRRILLVEPPQVTRAHAAVVPPRYAALHGGRDESRHDLGPGRDERASLRSLLPGSRIEFTIAFNKPLPAPPADPTRRLEWIAGALGPDAAKLARAGEDHDFHADLSDDAWTLSWTLDQSVRFAVSVEDEHGIPATDEAAFRFEASPDRPPTVTVTSPDADRSVLPTAVVDVRAEARDDVGLRWLALEHRTATPPADSPGAPPEPRADHTRFHTTQPDDGDDDSRTRLLAAQRLDLSTLGLRPGDELHLSALAADAFELDGRRREPVRSSARRLRIISEQDLIEQIWSELATVRRSAIRLHEDQTRLPSRLEDAEAGRRPPRDQSAVTERIARQRETIDALTNRMRDNALSDEPLERLLRDAGLHLDRAGDASTDATDALREAEQAHDAENQQAQRDAEDRATDRQDDVRANLESLIALLDRGEDTWATRRALERLLDDQRELRERTREAARETAGRPADELTPEQADALSELARDQRSAAEQAADAVRSMLEQERAMQQSDPAMSISLAEAVSRAESQRLEESMQRAAEQIEQNRTSAAGGRQQSAIETLEQMLQDLDGAARNRDEVLRRFLATIIESIESLIHQQQSELARLEAAAQSGDFGGLDTRMILLHRNTLGVVEAADAGPAELAPVSRLLSRAADAQTAAIGALRQDPVDHPEAEQHENRSLDRLRRALEEARRLDREAAQREIMRQRDELRALYREALQTQVSIRNDARDAAQDEGRRRRAAALQAGAAQRELSQSLEQIRARLAQIGDTVVFDLAHDRMDRLSSRAAATLLDGDADDSVTRDQRAVERILRSLIDALDDSAGDDDDPFSDGGAGGGDGPPDGAGEAIPPAAEVRLLRAMQAELAELTREADQATTQREQLVEDAASFQHDLFEHGRRLLQRMQDQQRPPEPQQPPQPPQPPQPQDNHAPDNQPPGNSNANGEDAP